MQNSCFRKIIVSGSGCGERARGSADLGKDKAQASSVVQTTVGAVRMRRDH